MQSNSVTIKNYVIFINPKCSEIYLVYVVSKLEVLDVDALPHAHALDLVNEERVGLDGNILLQRQLVTNQALQRGLCLG